MSYQVIFEPDAEQQLLELYHYLADRASPDIALAYTDAIIAHCENLDTFPLRGRLRSDVRPNLRITNYKKRTVIAYYANEDARRVHILGVFYGGQDFESYLQDC